MNSLAALKLCFASSAIPVALIRISETEGSETVLYGNSAYEASASLFARVLKNAALRQAIRDVASEKGDQGVVVRVGTGVFHVRLTNPEPELCVCLFTDISAETAREALIHEDYQRLRSMIDSIPGVVVAFSSLEKSKLLFVTNAFCQLMKDSMDNIIGLYGQDVMFGVHPDDREKVLAGVQTAFELGQEFRATYRLRNSRDEWLWVSSTGAIIRNEPDLLVIHLLYVDVTRERESQRAHAMNEALFRTAISLTDISVWVYDIPSRRVHQSAHSTRCRGNSEDILKNVPRSLVEAGHYHPDSVSEAIRVFDRIHAGEPFVEADLQVWDGKENSYWWERVRYSTFFDDEGRPIKAVAVGKDVTQEKLIDEKYQEALAYNDMMLGRSLSSLSLNITQDRLEQYSGDLLSIQKDSMTSLFARSRRNIPHETDKKRYDAVYTRENLLRAFESGETNLSVEVLYDVGGGRCEWLEIPIRMARHPKTGDVVGFSYAVNIHERKVYSLVCEKTVSTDYDCVAYIDASNDTVLGFLQPGDPVLARKQKGC